MLKWIPRGYIFQILMLEVKKTVQLPQQMLLSCKKKKKKKL